MKLSEFSSEEARHAYETRYHRYDLDGVIHEVPTEYATMSLKPGIGQAWFHKYWRDIYPSDELVMNGAKMRPPRYYDRLLERQDPALFEQVRKQRISEFDTTDTTPARLRVQEMCKEAELLQNSHRN